MLIINLFPKADHDVALQIFEALVMKLKENSIGRRRYMDTIPFVLKRLANLLRLHAGMTSRLLIQPIGKKRFKLYAKQPSFGKKRSMRVTKCIPLLLSSRNQE